ncbi:uncharacterized protein LOC125519343 [Triticum urartu]|uniref:uncharacterized protein LOC125519343 n=1 Tax=Triticum urartu TaxID=4572 RepID=UPI0020430771|nr:uncharacterized protein LOC125519343 [Triticum urartu]
MYPTVDPYPDQLRRRFRRLRPHSPGCAIEPGLLTSILMVARRESPLPAATQPCLVPYKGRRRRMLSSSVPNATELSCRCSLMLHMSVSFGMMYIWWSSSQGTFSSCCDSPPPAALLCSTASMHG